MGSSEAESVGPFESAETPPVEAGGPRLFLYSHDTYGLGHFRRNLVLARALVRSLPEASILCATGSPRSHSFPLPPRFDYLKLPSTTKDGDGVYRSRALALPIAEVAEMRSRILREAALSFRPDLVLVDHAPLGMAGELEPTLRALRERLPETRMVLGLRDIVDSAERVREQWSGAAYREALEDLYERILVYGSPRVFDLPREYGFPESVREKVRFTGYLAPDPPPAPRAKTRAALDLGRRRLVLVTVGGGGDGAPLLRAYLRALEVGPPPSFLSLLVTGPLLSHGKRARIRAAAAGRKDARVVDFAPNIPDLVAASDLVVSMAGYNTVCEILACGANAILVPRVAPRLEQLERAQRLASLGLVRRLPSGRLRAATLREAVEEALADRRVPEEPPLEFGAGEAVSSEIAGLLARPEPVLLG